MELKIEYLAPYLPFELEFQRKGTGFTMIGIEHNYVKSLESPYDWFDFSEIKPYMRPYSDLLKEIESQGKKFIPLIELARISTLDKIESFTSSENETSFGIKYIDSDEENIIFSFSKETNQFYLHFESNERFFPINHTFELYRKLYEWHFGFGLVEAGIAIDVNTVK